MVGFAALTSLSIFVTKIGNSFPAKLKQTYMRISFRLILGFAAFLCLLFALSGCTRLKVKMGAKVYLDKTPVAAMGASFPRGGLAPGEKAQLIVSFTQPNGKVLQTEGEGHGPVMWKDLAVTGNVVDVSSKGVVSLPMDPRASDGKTGRVSITVPSHPDLRAELNIPVRYNHNYYSDFSGSKGSDGFKGSDGISGTSGTSGSFDPNHPSAGGNGSNGSDGSNGGSGSRGGNGLPVNIQMHLRTWGPILLEIKVTGGGRQQLYLLDPHGGSLTVRSDGGDGGRGGKGGSGGRGGSGGIGSPNGSDGRSGSDGHDGSDGISGNGGMITVIYDREAQPYLSALHLSSYHGPRPVFREDTVGPLW